MMKDQFSRQSFLGEGSQRRGAEDDFPDRLFSWWDQSRLLAVVEGAGFEIDGIETDDRHIAIDATRARMLPDLVRPGLRILFCGYNPSLYAADRGVPPAPSATRGICRVGTCHPAACRAALPERSPAANARPCPAVLPPPSRRAVARRA